MSAPSLVPDPRPGGHGWPDGDSAGTDRAGTDRAGTDRVHVTVVATPAGDRLLPRWQTDVVRLTRTDGRVTASTRLAASNAAGVPPPVAEAARTTVAEALQAVADGLAALRAGSGGAGRTRPRERQPRLQSVRLAVGRRPDAELDLLARAESAGGPVLVGAVGPEAVSDLVRRLQRWPDVDPSLPPWPGWDDRPLVLRPPVAAALVAGIRLALASASSAQLEGRRVLPALTLTDHPIAHVAPEPDDAGRPAEDWTLLRDGQVRRMPIDESTGLPVGRAVWDHDLGRAALGSGYALTLVGRGTDEPAAATELVECVEGLRRYHTDGRMRLVCLARPTRGLPAPAARVVLTARPLTLARAVLGVTGESRLAWSDHQVRTPSRLLPPAAQLEGNHHVSLRAL
jgi:hypothetical protein